MLLSVPVVSAAVFCIKAGKGLGKALGECEPSKMGNQAGKGGGLCREGL